MNSLPKGVRPKLCVANRVVRLTDRMRNDGHHRGYDIVGAVGLDNADDLESNGHLLVGQRVVMLRIIHDHHRES
ncbi:hypothetical protein AGR2A_Lc140005 [Agrobacterium genomosp. 2 str. CFBP 5494]|uniref:Uncharacterized protein n=1 Tax=Agrobacterium genomosp. 2 str. CFBP 5494 TaxID=1183436 RepID=A0A9W5B305_9HYPH|nr:hypothetical protein AGR2A_Lc140005 [Agrobacterium genomosp. 2 str. CFBP 5494]